MKKIISLVLGLVMIAGIAFTVTSCGSKSKKTGIVDTWEMNFNMGKIIESYDEIDTSLFDVLGVSLDGTIRLMLEFKDDGQFTFQPNEGDMKKYVIGIIDKTIEATGMSEEAFLAQAGVSSKEEAAEAMFSSKDMTSSGTYEYKDGKLTMNGKEQKIKLENDTLTFTDIEFSEDSPLSGSTLVFRRSK